MMSSKQKRTRIAIVNADVPFPFESLNCLLAEFVTIDSYAEASVTEICRMNPDVLIVHHAGPGDDGILFVNRVGLLIPQMPIIFAAEQSVFETHRLSVLSARHMYPVVLPAVPALFDQCLAHCIEQMRSIKLAPESLTGRANIDWIGPAVSRIYLARGLDYPGHKNLVRRFRYHLGTAIGFGKSVVFDLSDITAADNYGIEFIREAAGELIARGYAKVYIAGANGMIADSLAALRAIGRAELRPDASAAIAELVPPDADWQ